MDRVEGGLIQRAKRGDTKAFAELYQTNVQKVYRYIYHRTNDTQMAEDLTSEVFTRAFKAIREYQDQGKPFVAWLYSIAHARVVDQYRKAERRPPESDLDDEPIPVNSDMDSELIRSQAAKILKDAISRLTGEQQQVVILRFVENYHLEEVATIMGKNANAIKALQHRALRALAARLERANIDLETILAGLS